jgi:hypothetical protein
VFFDIECVLWNRHRNVTFKCTSLGTHSEKIVLFYIECVLWNRHRNVAACAGLRRRAVPLCVHLLQSAFFEKRLLLLLIRRYGGALRRKPGIKRKGKENKIGVR